MWAVIERCQWWWMMLGVNGQLNSSPSCSAVSTTAALRPDKRVRKCQAAESKRCEHVFCGEKKKKSHLSSSNSSNSSTLIFYACKSGCSLIPPQLGRFSSQLFCYVQLVLQSYRCNHCLNYKATLVTTHWLHLHWRDLILDLIAAYVCFFVTIVIKPVFPPWDNCWRKMFYIKCLTRSAWGRLRAYCDECLMLSRQDKKRQTSETNMS